MSERYKVDGGMDTGLVSSLAELIGRLRELEFRSSGFPSIPTDAFVAFPGGVQGFLDELNTAIAPVIENYRQMAINELDRQVRQEREI